MTNPSTPRADRRIVAYRSPGRRVLRCLTHATRELIGTDLHPVTAADLPDGGTCTHIDRRGNVCGVDVLIAPGQSAAAPERPGKDTRAQLETAPDRDECLTHIAGACNGATRDCVHRQTAAPQPQTTPDACRPVVLPGGEVIRVRGDGEPTDRDRQYLAEVVDAARRRYAAEHSEQPQTTPSAERPAEH